MLLRATGSSVEDSGDACTCSALEEMPAAASVALTLEERIAGSLFGLVIGDALSMPVKARQGFCVSLF